MAAKGRRTKRQEHASALIAILLHTDSAWLKIDDHEYWLQGFGGHYVFRVDPGEHEISTTTAQWGSIANLREKLGRKTTASHERVWLDAGGAIGLLLTYLFGKETLRTTADEPEVIWAALPALDPEHIKNVPPDGESDLARFLAGAQASLADPVVVETDRTARN